MNYIDLLEEEYLSSDNEILIPYIEKIKRLHKSERRIFILYLEFGSRRKLAEYLNCSHTKVNYLIKNILKKIRC